MKVYLVIETVVQPTVAKPNAEIFRTLAEAQEYVKDSWGFEYSIQEYDVVARTATFVQPWKEYYGE